jgi:hypothetical protein
MKNWKRVAIGLAVAGSQLSHAGTPLSGGLGQPDTLSLQVGYGPFQEEQARVVSELEAAQVRGKVLPYVLGVAAVDLALASFYWGFYVPFYADKEPEH